MTVTPDAHRIVGADGQPVTREPQRITWDPVQAEKGGYRHFMLKEIHEQPRAVRDTLLGPDRARGGRGPPGGAGRRGRGAEARQARDAARLRDELARRARRQVPPGAGRAGSRPRSTTAASSAIARRSWAPRRWPWPSRQSGETADTLAAFREAKRLGALPIAICNVQGSMLTREAAGTLLTHAGPEIGVASTKAFTSQIVALALLALHLGRLRGTLSTERCRELLESLARVPHLMENALAMSGRIEEVAKWMATAARLPVPRPRRQLPDRARGRAQDEGDLLHPRRGLPGRRDEARPHRAHRREHAGGGAVPAGPDLRQDAVERPGSEGARRTRDRRHLPGRHRGAARSSTRAPTSSSTCPPVDEVWSPLLMVLPLQLLAYHVAVRAGRDVDQPRNLAKSVTVE